MKRFVLAIALVCVLSVSALAGEIHSVGAPSPVAPPAPGDVLIPGLTSSGDMGNGGNQGAGGFALLILDWLF